MRDLKRNQRTFYYATVTGTEPIYDEYGNDTLETRTIYSAPLILKANIISLFVGPAFSCLSGHPGCNFVLIISIFSFPTELPEAFFLQKQRMYIDYLQ